MKFPCITFEWWYGCSYFLCEHQQCARNPHDSPDLSRETLGCSLDTNDEDVAARERQYHAGWSQPMAMGGAIPAQQHVDVVCVQGGVQNHTHYDIIFIADYFWSKPFTKGV